MRQNFKQAVVAITGAGSGIGEALALALAKQGCHLSLSDRDADRLAAVERACQACNPKIRVLATTVDVSDNDAVVAWADATAAYFPEVNVVINNAGVSLSASVESMAQADFEWLMNINFWGVVYGTTAFLPILKRAKWGHIVNISSLFGLISMPNQSAYNAAKFAVRGFSESLALELKSSQSSVSLTCVHPGGVKTNIVNDGRFFDQVGNDDSVDVQKQRFNSELAKTTADDAAKEIIRAIRRDQSRLLVGRDAKIIDVIQRLLPSGYKHLVLKLMP
ncbi:Putative oxidoreductase SadH [BD1-7 clade bacterium]|nr:Putative oxidoreductase SadH [BD1-7 clade bacterium]